MRSLFVAALTLAVSFTASAKVNQVEFRALDQTAETQLCMAAAQGGIAEAKAVARSLGMKYSEVKRKTYCNETSLSRFAAKYDAQAALSVKDVVFKFVAADEALASQICRDAVVNGLDAAQAQYKNIDAIYCNGEIISRFVRKHKS
ncbi:hypothetical protein [Thalassotalea montiporae]